MSEPGFGQEYAEEYDIIYGDKDYEAECDLLETAFKRYSNNPVQTILDIGCGTGNHAIPLVHRGYRVTGVDRSPGMLEHAKQKISTYQPSMADRITFIQGDARDLNLKQNFDAVIMMFSVLGLQTTNAEVLSTLNTVRQNLKTGGMFIFDVWYGPAVLTIRPSERIKVIPTIDGQVIRSASGTLDIFRHLCGVHFHVWRLSNSRLSNEADEIQWTRYFFPQELTFYMEQAHLELVHMSAMGNLDQEATDKTWNILVVGKAI